MLLSDALELLDVRLEDDERDIRRAWKLRSRQVHPDKARLNADAAARTEMR